MKTPLSRDPAAIAQAAEMLLGKVRAEQLITAGLVGNKFLEQVMEGEAPTREEGAKCILVLELSGAFPLLRKGDYEEEDLGEALARALDFWSLLGPPSPELIETIEERIAAAKKRFIAVYN